METRIIIRAKAVDAKFIGTSMGGGMVMIRDAMSGDVLQQGTLAGGTGNTDLIMSKPHVRGMHLTDDTTAMHMAVLDLEQPRKIEIIVYAPLAQQQNIARACVTTWVVPGKHILGDGIVLNIPGFALSITNPPTHTVLNEPTIIQLVASVQPMCGCPVNPQTYWNPSDYEVAAIIKKDGAKVDTVNLDFTGRTNYFAASIPIKENGVYQFTVYAYDAATGNTGVDTTTVILEPNSSDGTN